MSNKIDNIGDLFRETLGNHRMDSGAHLWDKLETQLSAQPPVSAPHTSLIHHLSWVKVAVAASVILSAALAFNYIYLPLKDAVKLNQTTNPVQKIDNSNSSAIMADSTASDKDLQTHEIYQQSTQNDVKNHPNLPQSSSFVKLNDQSQTPLYSSANNTPSSLVTNANPPITQPNNTIANPVNAVNNNVSKSDTQKDSLRQPITNSNPIITPVNTTINQVLAKKEEVIRDEDIPNVFTPNNDGFNDYFVIRNIEKCSNNHLVIKDRNGKTVFDKINYQNDWDGKNVADGVYFFFLKCNSPDNNFGKMGSVNIRR
ncbi:MAG: gliding motility-associated C-terminal domain-containing protein [Bacteroidota bacterium]